MIRRELVPIFLFDLIGVVIDMISASLVAHLLEKEHSSPYQRCGPFQWELQHRMPSAGSQEARQGHECTSERGC